MRRLLGFAVCLLAASCGGDGSNPTSPTVERVSGVWIGNATLTSATGGECVGTTLAGAIGSRDMFSARIQQSENVLGASITYQGNHTSCIYTGAFRSPDVRLDLDSCPNGRIETFQCTDGSVRQLELVTGQFTARVQTTTGTGTDRTTWNVYAPGRGAPVGVLDMSTQFVWNLLGIPHSDFHVFDGSVRPGYVDGVTVILEEPDPFCEVCGWFGFVE